MIRFNTQRSTPNAQRPIVGCEYSNSLSFVERWALDVGQPAPFYGGWTLSLR
jgi:hypothetical protein